MCALQKACDDDHATKFARWQHPAMGVRRGLLCLAHHLSLYILLCHCLFIVCNCEHMSVKIAQLSVLLALTEQLFKTPSKIGLMILSLASYNIAV